MNRRAIRTDAPRPAPFAVGTRLRYLGTSDVSYSNDAGDMVRMLHPGIEVTIERTDYEHRGTGRRIDDDQDDGPIYDETRDHVSIYRINGAGRCIDHDDAHSWQVLDGPREKTQ